MNQLAHFLSNLILVPWTLMSYPSWSLWDPSSYLVCGYIHSWLLLVMHEVLLWWLLPQTLVLELILVLVLVLILVLFL